MASEAGMGPDNADAALASDTKPLFAAFRKHLSISATHEPPQYTELREALCLDSADLVKELYETAVRQIKTEAERQGRLDAKATSLLTASGLSLTVAFTFGGQILIGRASDFAELLPKTWHQSAVIIGIGAACGLLSSGLALWSLMVHGRYVTLETGAVFNKDILRNVDSRVVAVEADSTTESIARAKALGERAVTEYRRYIIPQLWDISQSHLNNHEFKSWLIQIGQILYVLFVMITMLLVTLVVYHIYMSH